jgi:hypothetical protein
MPFIMLPFKERLTAVDLRSEEDGMKRQSIFVRRDWAFRIVAAVCAVAISILGFAEGTEAQSPAPSVLPSAQFSSGMIGLASGQTARLNVVNVGVPNMFPLPCVLALAFLDSDNKILKQMFVSVGFGKAAFVDLVMSNGGTGRVQIRGIGYNPLLSPGSAIPQPLSCNLVPTLELFDTETGRTAAIVTDFRTPGSSVSNP